MASAASHSSHAMHARQSGANSFINGASLAPSNIASTFSDLSWTTTILVLVATLLVLEQSVYRYKKAHLPGAKWTIPVIGKFAGEVFRGTHLLIDSTDLIESRNRLARSHNGEIQEDLGDSFGCCQRIQHVSNLYTLLFLFSCYSLAPPSRKKASKKKAAVPP